MAHNIHGKMVYSFEQPMWHAITEPSDEKLTAVEVFEKKFGGGYGIVLRPVSIELNKETQETGDFAIVRTPTPYDNKEVVFGYCSEHFTPLQPVQIAEKFDYHVAQHPETIGALGNGEEMFFTWKLPSFEVLAGDPVDMYGCVKSGFDTKKGQSLFLAAVRIVCRNTQALAENWAKNNGGKIWNGKATNKNLIDHLGFWMEHVQANAIKQASLVESFFRKLAQTPIKNDAEVQEILATAYPTTEDVSPFYPYQLRDAKKERIDAYNETQMGIRVGIGELFSGAGTQITPTLWGMQNAMSEFLCHVMPSKKPIAESVMFGNRNKLSMQMIEVLKDRSR
jgi:hypothetical protein